MKLKTIIFAFILIGFSQTYGQQADPGSKPASKPATRLSVELNGGVPLGFATLPSAFSTYGGVGIRYNVTTALSAQFSANFGTLRGNQNAIRSYSDLSIDAPSTYTRYQSNFTNFMGRGMINLDRVLRTRPLLKRINPYLVFGAGYTINSSMEAERFDGRKRVYNDIMFWSYNAGLLFRVYINPTLDLNIGSEFYTTQSQFLDALPTDGKNDSYLLSYVGINVKFGASKSKQHIEWQNIIYKEVKPRKPRKEEEKPEQQPVVAQTQPEKPKDTSVIAVQTEVPKPNNNSTIKADSTQVVMEIPAEAKPKSDKQVLTTPKASASNSGRKKSATVAAPKTKPAADTKINRIIAANDKNAATLNMIEGVAEKTPGKYTVMAGAYAKSKISYAYMFRDRLRAQGYSAALVQSDINPNIVRVMIYSTNDRKVALQQCYKGRNEIEKTTWINVAK
jgi:hypothetical protein